MKNKILLIFAIILMMSFVGGVTMSILSESRKVGTFDIATYSKYIDEFPSEKILGPISDRKTAKEKAESLFREIYGDSVKSKKPYTVSFDEKSQVWLVEGSLPENHDGGVPHILIRKSDGKVLAVWHDK